MPGSEGAHSSGSRPGGWGGGLFHLTVRGTAQVDGAISMNGGSPTGSQGTGGSGGAVNIHCRALRGSGGIAANGGKGASQTSYAGPGGGGRIAIYASSTNAFTGTITAAAGSDTYTYSKPATDGTVYYRITGGMMVILR